jgi:hypothetical protein
VAVLQQAGGPDGCCFLAGGPRNGADTSAETAGLVGGARQDAPGQPGSADQEEASLAGSRAVAASNLPERGQCVRLDYAADLNKIIVRFVC